MSSASGEADRAQRGVIESPRFLEDLVITDAEAERLRLLGGVDLALHVSRDGEVSEIEVLSPILNAMDYAWLAALIAKAKVAPRKVDGIAVRFRWVIRLSVPEKIEAETG